MSLEITVAQGRFITPDGMTLKTFHATIEVVTLATIIDSETRAPYLRSNTTGYKIVKECYKLTILYGGTTYSLFTDDQQFRPKVGRVYQFDLGHDSRIIISPVYKVMTQAQEYLCL